MTITKEQSNFVKLIAIITMTIDHVGLLLLDNDMLFRIIGRIAFPLFAYQLAVGYLHTSNLKKYVTRLLLLGFIFQVPYYFIDPSLPMTFNILVTLGIGLICIFLYDKKKFIPLTAILTLTFIMDYYEEILIFFKAEEGMLYGIKNYIISFDYGIYGLLAILLMYAFINKIQILIPSFIALNLLFIYALDISTLQIFSIMALFFLIKPLDLKYKISGWLFYLYYPLHFVIIYLVKEIGGIL